MLDIFYNTDNLIKEESNSSCVVLGDCIDTLRKIKTGSIDLVFADPPYGIGKDFGVSKDSFSDVEEYLDWCKAWIDECMRVLKPTGTMYFLSSTQYMSALDRYVDERYFVINRIVWVYDSSGVQSKSKFGSLYEPILMITHSPKADYTFNTQDILVDAKTGSERR
ncbi:MAG: adenine-specific DNA-methyltransferase, partial [Oscillospiraceae bacterium]|nr:adenine-specific DNA-methyltransferase [Oscillospiraceae bacterium]